MKVLCVHRAEIFSPNKISDDEAIINDVAERLRSEGNWVEHCNENALVDISFIPDAVVSMGRHSNTLALLRKMERLGVVVLNSVDGVENCGRMQFTQLFLSNSISMPQSLIININEQVQLSSLNYPCWIKKGEGYAEQKDDVVYVTSATEALDVLQRMKQRGINHVTVSSHEEGDLVKFYGVAGTDFFRWYYAYDGNCKFGLESINGAPVRWKFAQHELRQLCDKAAQVLGVEVYGGDCVIKDNNEIKIIDFNDWPSFSRYREDAAEAIAKKINSKYGKR